MGEKGSGGKKTCFVITPIDEEGTEIRKRADQLLKHIVGPVTESMGYAAIRADLIPQPGVITRQVIQGGIDSSIVIADLTGHNPNVFYELAVRHAVKRPYVQMIDSKEQIPFDIADTRTIIFDIHDMDSVEAAKQKLTNQIRSIEGGKAEVDNPVSMAVDLKILKESQNPTQRSLAELTEAIAEIRIIVRNIEERLDSRRSRPRFFDAALDAELAKMWEETLKHLKEYDEREYRAAEDEKRGRKSKTGSSDEGKE